jgi:serine/threonine protein kinase
LATASILRPGDVIRGFRVDELIGVGGTAVVYRAEQLSLGRPVALKVLSDRLASDDAFRERFRREGKHLAALEHPNIVPVHDSGESDGLLYLAMRLVDGTNLAEMIRGRRLTADRIVEILKPIAGALDAAHADGLIHRDVKPQNILVTERGHPYLADFGVAKGSNTFGLTATGGFVGSVNYASPEQIYGSTLTAASDIYALAAVLYHCLTGQAPYIRESDAAIMHAQLHDPPPVLPDGDGDELNLAITRGMAKLPEARHHDAQELLAAVTRAVSRLSLTRRDAIPAFPPGEIDLSLSRRSQFSLSLQSDTKGDSRTASPTAADRRRRPRIASTVAAAAPVRRWQLVAVLLVGLTIVIVAIVLIALSGAAKKTVLRPEPLNLTSSLAAAVEPRTRILENRAHDRRALATAELRLAAGDTKAASNLAGLSIESPPRRLAIAGLVGSLQQEAQTMRTLASSARSNSRSAYSRALDRLPALQAGLGGALHTASTNGFSAPTLPEIKSHTLALPAPRKHPRKASASSALASKTTPTVTSSAPTPTTPEPVHESSAAPPAKNTGSSNGSSSPRYGPTVVSPPVG